jgi:hypothetical protein
MSRNLPHRRKLYLFVLLSLADLFLTWCLLHQDQGPFFESNPVAGWWLQRHGWLGLVAFKAATVLVAAALLVVVSRYRPRTAGNALVLACALVGGVVFYSCYLAQANASTTAEVRSLLEDHERLEALGNRLRAYVALRERMIDEIIAGRFTLSAAAEQLIWMERCRDPRGMCFLRACYAGYSLKECVAAQLMVTSVERLQGDRPAAQRLGQQLDDEFQTSFGQSSPAEYRAVLRRLEVVPRSASSR